MHNKNRVNQIEWVKINSNQLISLLWLFFSYLILFRFFSLTMTAYIKRNIHWTLFTSTILTFMFYMFYMIWDSYVRFLWGFVFFFFWWVALWCDLCNEYVWFLFGFVYFCFRTCTYGEFVSMCIENVYVLTDI